MVDHEDPTPAAPEPESLPKPPTGEAEVCIVTTAALFAGRREITIEHEGERYRLRITRRNKLILQK